MSHLHLRTRFTNSKGIPTKPWPLWLLIPVLIIYIPIAIIAYACGVEE